MDQLQIFGYSCLFGVVLGAIYDVFRIIRLLRRWETLAIILQDVIYFTLIGVATFLFMLVFNYGEIRFYIIAGEAIGWIVYYITIGEISYRFSSSAIGFIRRILIKAWHVLLAPMRGVKKALKARNPKKEIVDKKM